MDAARTVVGALILLFALLLQAPAQESPSKSVILLTTMEQSRSVSYGTGFFIASDGTALTSSHVVYQVHTAPAKYQLLAIVNGEFFSATLICASDLPYDPTKVSDLPTMSRDVAEIRLRPSQFPFQQYMINGRPYATAHRGPLPSFPALTLGENPSLGDEIRVLGFGYLESTPIPYEWSASGTVKAVGAAGDGTAVFGILFARPAVPGHSGSPVLNAASEVVGIWNWFNRTETQRGVAIGVSALRPACP